MDGQAISELSETGNKIVGDTLLILLNAQFQSILFFHFIIDLSPSFSLFFELFPDVLFKLPSHQSGRPWQLLLSSDRALKHRISALYAAGMKTIQ